MDFKALNTLLVVVVVLHSVQQCYYGAEGKRWALSEDEDLELERQLKILNKPPIKTIRTEVGDIFDCIDIYKQPAFDHPLLKNHKIQMEPNILRGGIKKEATSTVAKASKTMLELHNERCPSGTVPIRRTTKEDLINAKYFAKQTKSFGVDSTYPLQSMDYHVVSVQPDNKVIYHGGSATINVQNPAVQQDQFSTAQMWVQNGPEQDVNSIETGWAVYPRLFGDNLTRLFGYWTADGYKQTGCFNTLCSGFVQVGSRRAFGDALKSSTPEEDRVIDALVSQDPVTGHWWLFSNNELQVGYWPKELFPHLASNTSVIRYGGVAGANPNRPTPPMGNGNFSVDDYTKTCYISYMQVVVENGGRPVDFDPSSVLWKQDTTDECYQAVFNGYKIEHEKLSMAFGGPGGRCEDRL